MVSDMGKEHTSHHGNNDKAKDGIVTLFEVKNAQIYFLKTCTLRMCHVPKFASLGIISNP